MCVICAGFRPAEPDCVYTGLSNTIVEVTDAPASALTPYDIGAGDVFSGTLDPAGDRDWVRITLDAGQEYQVSLRGTPSAGGTLSDPYLRLYDANGTLVSLDDDGGAGRDSQIIISGSSGVFYVEAGSYQDNGAGTYTLSLTTARSGEPVDSTTLSTMSSFLTEGYWESMGRGSGTRSWSADEITVNLTGLTAEGQQLARWAFEAWEMVTDLRFTEITGTANITFQDDDPGAYANFSTIGGSIVSAMVNVGTSWLNSYGTTLGSYSFATYIHEIGHALGLGHQGPYNSSATYLVDNSFALDSWQMSIMSYFNQNENTFIDASYARGASAQMVDIHAIQALYGAAGANSATAGNTVWGANSTLDNYMGTLFAAMFGEISSAGIYNNGPVMVTIYDVGGHDTLNLGVLTTGSRIDLRGATFSDINGETGNMGIASGTVIEDVTAGSGNDTITGNAAANLIRAGAGNDLIYASGNDTVYGGAGSDTLVLAPGEERTAEWMSVTGNGSYQGVIYFDDGTTLRFFEMETLPDLPRTVPVPQFLQGTADADTLVGGAGDDTVWAAAGDDFIDLRGGGDNIAYGGRDDDTLMGGAGNDMLGGAAGDDLLDARAGGMNELWGGGGNDTIYGGNNGDRIGGGADDDLITAGNGTDEIYGGGGNDTVNAGGGNDTVYGGTGSDVIRGDAGNDVISAGGGFDQLWGNDGADTFQFYRNFNWNNVMDFNAAGGDTIALTQWLWRSALGNLTAQQVVDQFASVNDAGNVVLDFGGANTQIQLMGYSDLAGLADHIDIVA